jgi:hypothetical protein
MILGAPNKVIDFIEEITIALGAITTTLRREDCLQMGSQPSV